MQRIILTYGVIAGFVVAIPLFLMGTLMADNPPSGGVGMAIGYLIMLIAFTAIFVAVKKHRDDRCGGVIRFLPALGMGAAIALIASLFYVVAWEAVLAINGGDYIARMSAAALAKREAAGASAAQIAELRAQLASLQQLYADPLLRMLITLSEVLWVGLTVALVAAVSLGTLPRPFQKRRA